MDLRVLGRLQLVGGDMLAPTLRWLELPWWVTISDGRRRGERYDAIGVTADQERFSSSHSAALPLSAKGRVDLVDPSSKKKGLLMASRAVPFRLHRIWPGV